MNILMLNMYLSLFDSLSDKFEATILFYGV